jgi:hypothetical protein
MAQRRFVFDYVVSLGPSCLPGLQARKFFPRHQRLNNPFTSQYTPTDALIAYFDSDFRGMFERDDLYVRDQDGFIGNRRYGTFHPHEFPEGLDSYDTARSRHEHLCAKLRTMIDRPDAALLFVTYAAGEREIEIEDAIRRRAPNLAFRLLNIPHPHPGHVDLWRVPQPEWQEAFSMAKRQWGPRSLTGHARQQLRRFASHISQL